MDNATIRELGEEEDMASDDFDWGNEASTFGDRLSRAREHAGMDQAQLARRIGVKTSTIKNWEADRSEPRANRLQMLSGLLNVSMMWLLTGDGEGIAGDGQPADTNSDLRKLLIELRELKVAQAQLSERTGRIEKSLRLMISHL